MKIMNYNDLEYAAKKKLAVYCPAANGFLKKPRPASFVMNQTIRIINGAIKAGLFIYVKENVQPVFFAGPGGALLCDRHIEGLTRTFPYDADGWHSAKYYGSHHIVGESMTTEAMKMICKHFNGIWKDVELPNEPF